MYEFPCPNPITASIRLAAGRVEIIAEERDTVTVDVSPQNPHDSASVDAAEATRVDLHGDTLIVEAPESGGGWLFRRPPHLRVEVHLPLDSTVQAKGASADLRCAGRLGGLSVQSASGDVSAEHVTGDLSVTTASGDVRIGQAHSQARTKSASGDLSIDYVGGDLTVATASGDVAVNVADGSVNATTASGDLRVGVARRGSLQVKSVSGDVSVGVASGTGVWLDLSSMSGDTVSDLDVASDAPATGCDLNLQVRTMSGDIAIRRVQAPAPA